jgi:ABC-type histidine transport system ATPase subunit
MSANSAIAVEFRNVTKSFGEKRVLDNVSFQIKRGGVRSRAKRYGQERYAQAHHGIDASRFR